MTHHLKHTVEIGGNYDVDKFFRHQAGFHTLAADDFHIFIGIIHLDFHQLLYKAGKLCTLRTVQKQPEYIKVVIDIVQHLHLVQGGVLTHFSKLSLFIKRMKFFLNFQKHLF